MNRLEDVDVDGVHLVGAPATRRPFALVKNLAGRKPEELETMKLTKADFKKRISTEIEGEIDDAKLQSLAKAIGIELTDTPAPKPVSKAEPNDKDDDADDDNALAKSLERVIEKATAPLMEKIAQLEKTNADAAKVALAKRVTTLTKAGYEIDAATITEPEVSAIEKAHERVVKLAEKAGLTKAFGSPEADEPTSGLPALQSLLAKKVREVLGREPLGKAEEAATKREIFRANPGMLTAITKAERAARAA